jgi:predicted RecB family nuclease
MARMATRHEVSSVPLQGGYVAKQCPVRAQNDVIRPVEPLPPDPFTERLFASGNAFDVEVVAEIRRLNPGAAWVDAIDAESREAATTSAMAAALSPILNARLPADVLGRRVGRPDLLVSALDGGYRAIDIKWHQNLEPAAGTASELPGRCAPLGDLRCEAAVVDADYGARKKQSDLLQLAHYQRMLEAAGMAANGRAFGGIIGTERRVVWYDLDAPIWRTPSSTGATKLRTTMERYDFEFHFRLDIIAVAEQHKLDSSVGLLVVPVRCSECPGCPWNGYCGPQLAAGFGDVSLLPRIGWTQWKVHRDHGVTDRAELAALDWQTASLVAAGIDVARLRSVAASLPIGLPVLSMGSVWNRPRQLELLDSRGLRTVADLVELDATTARYSGSGIALHEQIDMARAALGPAPVYKRRGMDRVAVPRADVEVDIDMECSEVGVYLWGCLHTDRRDPGAAISQYTAFVTWESLTPEGEAENSLEFWNWLVDLRSTTHEQNRTFCAYCYSADAENQYLRRLGISAGLEAEVAAFIASAEWVDLLKEWDTQLLTGVGSGLKTVAPLVGYEWKVDDAGGAASMVWYDAAAAGDDAARRWLLEYNRGDVGATRAVREWMGSTEVLGVESLAERFGARS